MQKKKKRCDRCTKDRYIWKNVTDPEKGRMKLCQSCYNIWSAQLNTEPKTSVARKPIRSRSQKRQKQESTYSKKRKSFLEEHPYCEVPVPGICQHKATDVHHVDGRVEDDLTNEEGFKAACRKCHMWVHDNPEAARELGYLI